MGVALDGIEGKEVWEGVGPAVHENGHNAQVEDIEWVFVVGVGIAIEINE